VSSRNWLRAAYAALFALAAFGSLANLDGRKLWGDEAETALLAISITHHGVPRVLDGHHRIANLPNGRDANADGLWTWSPWLDEYVTAGSFALLGPSTTAARLPFALLALGSMALLTRITWRAYRKHSVPLVLLSLLATSVPLLLHARQARYYALSLFAVCWLFHGIARACEAPGVRAAVHTALPLAILFYSNYLLAVAPAAAVAVFGLWRARGRAGSLGWLGLSAAGAFALALPWLIYANPAAQGTLIGSEGALERALYYLRQTQLHVIPAVVLALPLLLRPVHALRGQATPHAPTESARALEFFAWSLLLLGLVVYAASPFRFFRYLIPIIPAILLLAAAYLGRFLPSKGLRAVVVLALILANGWTLEHASLRVVGVPYLDFLQSIPHDYRTRLDAVSEYLAGEVTPGDRLWVPDPEFPLAFYSDVEVVDARLHKGVPVPPPEWILEASASSISPRLRLAIPPKVALLYDAIYLDTPRARHGGSRPDPNFYEAFEARRIEPFVLHRLR
jgi:hypothetical protein